MRASSSPDASGEPIVVRLVHPDRQAAEVLRLFDGSPAAHPAAALSAWKRATRVPDQLGKPLEAVISFLNPEMVREWQSFHEAEFFLGLDPDSSATCWRLIVPHDDGTLAALITSLRLSGGSQDAPLGEGKTAVDRLGGAGAAVAARGDRGVVVASSRAELDRGLSSAMQDVATGLGAGGNLDSGLAFRIEPGRFRVPIRASVPTRRAIELARGLGCRTILGGLRLHDDRLGLELDSTLDPGHPLARARGRNRAIELDWLRWVPAGEAMIVVCIATGQEEAYWKAVFALADHVDRADPQRADLAPLRTRINLLATAAGARLEADLWPHLRGLTLGLLADRARPGQPGRAVLAIHMDQEASARQLSADVLPRLAVLWGGPKVPRNPAQAHGPGAGSDLHDQARSLGRISGQPLEAAVRGRTVLIGWGEQSLASALDSAQHPEHSVLPLVKTRSACADPSVVDRVGVFWPGRIKLPIKGLDATAPLARCLAEGPPIVWTGWTNGEHAFDLVQWQELRPLVRKFLAQIPLEPALAP